MSPFAETLRSHIDLLNDQRFERWRASHNLTPPLLRSAPKALVGVLPIHECPAGCSFLTFIRLRESLDTTARARWFGIGCLSLSMINFVVTRARNIKPIAILMIFGDPARTNRFLKVAMKI